MIEIPLRKFVKSVIMDNHWYAMAHTISLPTGDHPTCIQIDGFTVYKAGVLVGDGNPPAVIYTDAQCSKSFAIYFC